MTDRRQLRADLSTFAAAVEQPLADWQASSMAGRRRSDARKV